MTTARLLFERAAYAIIGTALLSSLSSVRAQDGPHKVYLIGDGVSEPSLQPVEFTPPDTGRCTSSASGKVSLSMVVDENGHPRNIMFIKPRADDLDKLALKVVEADRFVPAMKDGAPVAVGQSVEVNLKACVAQQDDGAGQTKTVLRIVSVPKQKFKNDERLQGEIQFAPEESVPKTHGNNISRTSKVGGHVSAPVLLVAPDAEYTDLARIKGIDAICLIGLTVDQYGIPYNLHILKPANYGLDHNALIAVSRYRFKPAMKNTEPVPVLITIEVNFRLLKKVPM